MSHRELSGTFIKEKMREEPARTEKLESLGVLAGGIAHDFNNLMQVILSDISLAKMLSNPEDRIYKILENAENSYAIAISLTNELLVFSRGGRPVKKEICIEKCVTNAAHCILHGSGIRGKMEIPENLWHVNADERHLRRVFEKIILNARDAMPDGGKIKITVENTFVGSTEESTLDEGKYVKISVEDEGAGISEDNLTKIFDPYFTTKEMDSVKGKGLGLAVCYKIIKNHKGLITLESEPGVGTIFRIFLPASE